MNLNKNELQSKKKGGKDFIRKGMGKTQTSVSNGLCTREPRITQTILHPDIPIGTPTPALRTYSFL